jgi:hypothetical protein
MLLRRGRSGNAPPFSSSVIMSEAQDVNLLAPFEKPILALSGESNRDDILMWHERLKFYQQEATRMRDIVENALIAYIKTHGPIEFGNGVRYYLTHPKTVKCNDIPATVEAVFEATGGDFKRFCDVLASGAIKHGAAKKILPPKDYSALFTTTVKDKLETGEPAEKTLAKADDKFSR